MEWMTGVVAPLVDEGQDTCFVYFFFNVNIINTFENCVLSQIIQRLIL